jgi:hypothetical protein
MEFVMNAIITSALVPLALAGGAFAQVAVSVDRLDGSEPGTPVPDHLVIADVFVDVANTDTWTAAGMRGVTSNGATLVYAGTGPASLVNPGVETRLVTCLSQPRGRNDDLRFSNAGVAVAGLYSPAGPVAVASASEVNAVWFASPPPTASSPSVDGFIARVALDLSFAAVDIETIVIATSPPAGALTIFESVPAPGSTPPPPPGTVSSTFDFPALTGLSWGIYAQSGNGPPLKFNNNLFTIGNLSGWNIVNTANGTGGPGVVANIDIDGPGPLGVSPAARFAAGQSVAQTGQQGVEMTQILPLIAGVTYIVDFDWSAQRFSGTNAADGGNFSLIVNGASIAQASAGSTGPTLPRYGHLTGSFTPNLSGPASVGIRITRGFTPAADLFQYVDNLIISHPPAPCYPNCDGSTGSPLLTANDFQCFINSFAAGASYANCDASTGTPALTANDFQCFINAFAAGCS